MEKIASFQIDHNKLTPGVYISRIDGDIVTYDLRFIKPNTPPYLETPAMHTIEHLFATITRNSALRGRVIYFGPMGCRTGFYFLMRNTPHEKALQLIRDTVKEIAAFTGEIPGTTAIECGNYKEHDLKKAKESAAAFYDIIKNWTTGQMAYQ